MKFLLDELEQCSYDSDESRSGLRRAYRCHCKHVIFFRNSHCLSCNTPLGYEPRLGKVLPLAPGPEPETWQISGHSGNHFTLYRRCANLNTAAACNWLVKVNSQEDFGQRFCISCRLDRTIPDLSIPENQILWGRIELAKRRVISSLIALGLPVASRVGEDPERGLAFDLLRSPADGPRVLTGHDNGLITLNVEEADDAKREQIRASMHEPYRTLVGHFRHEVGHYYWDRLISESSWLEEFRRLFGDERADYEAAVRRNYEQRPQSNWALNYVSAYASIHPWEDWAETWAHYMHMVDTLATAMSLGLKVESVALPFDPFTVDALYPAEKDDSRFLSFLNAWLKLTAVLNELSRSMGQPDFYPFALPRAAVSKLHFVHTVVAATGFDAT
jgi:hypothetical protein